MESEANISEQLQQTERTSPRDTSIQNPKLSSTSGTSYAVIIKYDEGYVKSFDGILRLLHVVFVFFYLILIICGGTYEGNYLCLPFAWHLRLIVFTCIASLLISIFIIGLHMTSTISMFPVDWLIFDIVVYGTLAMLFLLSVILLGVDISNSSSYVQFIPPSTTRIHIAALVFGICCLLLHGSLTAVGLYQRTFLDHVAAASSRTCGILLSQQSSSSVGTAESALPSV